MKNFIKWTIIVILVAIFAIDVAGLWKFKLNGTKYVLNTESDAGEDSFSEPQEKIEYTKLTVADLKNNERFVIKNIDRNGGYQACYSS